MVRGASCNFFFRYDFIEWANVQTFTPVFALVWMDFSSRPGLSLIWPPSLALSFIGNQQTLNKQNHRSVCLWRCCLKRCALCEKHGVHYTNTPPSGCQVPSEPGGKWIQGSFFTPRLSKTSCCAGTKRGGNWMFLHPHTKRSGMCSSSPQLWLGSANPASVYSCLMRTLLKWFSPAGGHLTRDTEDREDESCLFVFKYKM